MLCHYVKRVKAKGDDQGNIKLFFFFFLTSILGKIIECQGPQEII